MMRTTKKTGNDTGKCICQKTTGLFWAGRQRITMLYFGSDRYVLHEDGAIFSSGMIVEACSTRKL